MDSKEKEGQNFLLNKSILFITHDYKAFIKDQIEILSPRFKEVFVLVRYKPIAEISRFFPFPFLLEHTFSSVFDLTNVPSNVHIYKVPLWYFPTKKGYKMLGYKHYKKIEEVIKTKNITFDIVHSHFIWSAGYAGMEISKKYKVPFVVTGHGYDVYELPFQDSYWRKKILEILEYTNKIITVSQGNKKYIKELNDNLEINVIGNGYIKSKFFRKSKTGCREKLKLSKKSIILLNIGGLDKVKGQTYLLEAVRLLVDMGYNIKCYIVGVGVLENILRKKIYQLGLSDSIFLVGAVPHANLVDWFNSADVFVLPSLSESFGIVQLEALACGVPVVATKNNGSIELLTSDDYGLLCNIADSKDLSEKIEIAIKKSWNSKKMIRYAQSFTWEKICSRLLQVYEDILS